MKKFFTFLITSSVCLSSLNLSANNGLKLSSLPDKNRPFMLHPVSDSDNGIKGKVMLTAGIGLNLFATYLEARYTLSTNYNFEGNITSHQSSPMFNAALDYGLGKRLSAGAAFGYQTARINFEDGTYGARYYDTWTRIHLAIRGDYYIIAKDNISLYTGAKFGYNMYTVNSTYNVPGYVSRLDVYPSVVSVQAHFGFSYYAGGRVGFNTEVGLGFGGPYLIAAGLAIKI